MPRRRIEKTGETSTDALARANPLRNLFQTKYEQGVATCRDYPLLAVDGESYRLHPRRPTGLKVP